VRARGGRPKKGKSCAFLIKGAHGDGSTCAIEPEKPLKIILKVASLL
jgi:hypothetical protein